MYYGVMTEDGVGDIIEGKNYTRKNNMWYIIVPVNKDKPELGDHQFECHHIFYIWNNELTYVKEWNKGGQT